MLLLAAACGPAPSGATAVPSPSGARRESAQLSAGATAVASTAGSTRPVALQTFDVPKASGPHDVAPAADGGVWYTAQLAGKLGWLDPKTGQVREIALGPGSAPHGVIVGPDGAPWITDGGQNAIVRVDPKTDEVTRYPLPSAYPRVDLNTAAFDRNGALWFTGQAGYYGRLDVRGFAGTRVIQMYAAPRGRGPYGMTVTPSGDVYYASLAGSYLGRIDATSGGTTVLEPPTKGQGARRAWSDSKGNVWVAEWDAGQLARYAPSTGAWTEWKPAGIAGANVYAVFVDDRDAVWITEWTTNALMRFDGTGAWESFPYGANGNVRQLLGRPGEVWGALSGQDKLMVVRTRI